MPAPLRSRVGSGRTGADLAKVVLAVPLGEGAQAGLEIGLGMIAQVALELRSVRVGHGHVAGLHGDELAVRLEVVARGEDALPHQHKRKQGQFVNPSTCKQQPSNDSYLLSGSVLIHATSQTYRSEHHQVFLGSKATFYKQQRELCVPLH